MEIDDQLFFSLIKESPLQIRAEIVSPAEAATLAAAAQASELGEGTPAAVAIGEDEGD